MIPKLLCRVVPEHTTDQVETWWNTARDLHPGWDHVTYRDPLDPDTFPLSAPHWAACTSGAQLAGLVRLEALTIHGGIYLDSDVELYRPLNRLLYLPAFAAWEDRQTIPDAVLGAEPGHRAVRLALELAIARLADGPWQSGPGVTTHVFRDDPEVLPLPPGTFYPYHYSEKHRAGERHDQAPWCFGAHHWAGSWLTT